MADTVTCASCGAEVAAHAFCNACGAAVPTAASEGGRRSERAQDLSVGDSVRNLRARSGMSVDDLAKATNIASSYIDRLEHGEVELTDFAATKLSKMLGVSEIQLRDGSWVDEGSEPKATSVVVATSDDTPKAKMGWKCDACECTTQPGDAKFCPDCGHHAISHRPHAAASIGCSECACTEPASTRAFCAVCGHASSSHVANSGSKVNPTPASVLDRWNGLSRDSKIGISIGLAFMLLVGGYSLLASESRSVAQAVERETGFAVSGCSKMGSDRTGVIDASYWRCTDADAPDEERMCVEWLSSDELGKETIEIVSAWEHEECGEE